MYRQWTTGTKWADGLADVDPVRHRGCARSSSG
jgi:hypothetical protein